MKRTEWPRPRWMHGHWAFWFYEQTYNENVHLIWPVSDAQRIAHIRREFGMEAEPRPNGWRANVAQIVLADPTANAGIVLSLRDWQDTSEDAARLSHEVFHVASDILTARGVTFDNNPGAANEAYAYLIQRLYLTCHTALSKGQRPQRKRSK